MAAAAITLPGFERYRFSPWFGPTLGLLVVGVGGSIYLWTRRPKLPVVDRWPAFEDAAGAGLAVLGIGLWLLLGWQLNALRGLLGPG